MQLDENTVISERGQLLVFVRLVHVDQIREEFLFCEFLLETRKAADILEIVKSFFCQTKL
jgi:hypothetical protein